MPIEETFTFLGANLDTRPEEAKLKDHSFVEVVAAANDVNWQQKPESQWRKFPDQDQNGAGSCVANTIRKLAYIQFTLKKPEFAKYGVYFSENSIYHYRSNKPGSGMIGVESFDIWKGHGITLEALVPGQKMSDEQMDAIEIDALAEEVAKSFEITGHVGVPNGDFETIASIIQTTGKGVMSWFYFTPSEWSPFGPKILVSGLDLYADSTARHSVAVVDFFLYPIDGVLKKCLLIEDSAHFGNITRRVITEDFFKARNWFNRYAMNYKFYDQTQPSPTPVPVDPKPIYTFSTALEFIPLDSNGNISDLAKNAAQEKDVIALQNILKYEGCMPINVGSTGYYGAITAKAVLKFQVKYSVASAQELASLAGRRVGPKTIDVLNMRYSH